MSTARDTAEHLLSILPLLNRAMTVELRKEEGDDTTMPQFRVLSYLYERPQTVSDIARTRRVSFQAAGELVQALVKRGWIDRAPNPDDRRQALLTLTETGRKHYERARERMTERMSELFEAISDEDQAMIQRALDLMRSALVLETEEEDA
jgi:DNA-binding MarR family transcriptional regulator